MKIPLLDLSAQVESLKGEALPAIMSVVEAQRFIMGEQVRSLEEALARYAGLEHAIGCASGTDALLLSLKTLDLKEGDEVLTTPFTFFATAGAIVNAGGTPRFVDILPDTFNIDIGQVEAAVTERTRAIVPVHLFGQMADMEGIRRIAQMYGLEVIEDAAQAIGARRKVGSDWISPGQLGTTGTFSFFPSKNLGAWGDGGMIVTDDAARAERLRRLRTHGGAKQYHHDEVGTNSRLDTLQAAVLLAKLPHLDGWNAARRENAARYDAAFADVAEVVTPAVDTGNEHTYHQYTIRADSRDELREFLTSVEVGSAVYYPRCLHLQPCFAPLGYRGGEFPVAEAASAQVLSLPVFPELARDQQDHVIERIREFFG